MRSFNSSSRAEWPAAVMGNLFIGSSSNSATKSQYDRIRFQFLQRPALDAGNNAAHQRATGQPPSVRIDDDGGTTSAARPIASLGQELAPSTHGTSCPSRHRRT